MYYLKAKVYSDDPDYYGADAGAWYASTGQFNSLIGDGAGRALLRASLDGIYQSRVTDARVESLAAYGQVDWHLNDKTILSFGLRQTEESKTNRVSHEHDRPGENLDALGATLGATAAQINAAYTIRDGQVNPALNWRDGHRIKASLTAWNLGPSYQLTDDVLLYSSLGKGVKSGFIFFATDDDATESHIKPEETYDLELGFKSLLFNRSLQLNVNAYYTRIKNYQASWQRDDPDAPGSYISGWGNVERIGAKGLEFQSSYRYSNRLTLDFNGAYNIAKYATQWLAQVPEIGSTRYFDLKGEQVTNVPKLTLSYGFNYQAPIGGFLGRVTLNNIWQSASYMNDSHASFTHQKAYNVTNLGIGLGSLDKSWEVSLLGRNVFDTSYYTSASTWSNTAAQSVTWGAPRTWLVVFKSKI